MIKESDMNDRLTGTDETVKDKYTKNMINRWCFLVETARRELHAAAWPQAANRYREAHFQAEFLLIISDCKNCAIKCYMRTLMEYAYALRKAGQKKLLSDVVAQAWCALNAYTTESLAAQLLKPLHDMESATSQAWEIFINQLFFQDAEYRYQVH